MMLHNTGSRKMPRGATRSPYAIGDSNSVELPTVNFQGLQSHVLVHFRGAIGMKISREGAKPRRGFHSTVILRIPIDSLVTGSIGHSGPSWWRRLTNFGKIFVGDPFTL